MKLISILICALGFAFLCGSCEENGGYRYVGVQLEGESRWSVLDLETGEILCLNKFDEEVSFGYDDGVLLKSNGKGAWEYVPISNPASRLGEPGYAQASLFDKNSDVAFVVSTEGRIMLINRDFEVVSTLPDEVTTVINFKGKRAPYCKNGKWGYLDEKGEEVIPARYDEVSVFRRNCALALTADKINVIDTDGKLRSVFNRRFYDIENVNLMGDEWLPVMKRGRVVFFDVNGEEKLSSPEMYPDYEGNYRMIEGKTVYYDGKRYGIIDKDGNVLVRPEYSFLFFHKNNLFLAQNEQGFGVINGNGEVVIPLKYDDVYSFRENRFLVRTGNSWVLLNEKNELLADKIGNISMIEDFQQLYSRVGMSQAVKCSNDVPSDSTAVN